MDLNPGTLEFLVHLMCAQARECLFEKGELVLFEEDKDAKLDTDTCLALGQEAAHVSTWSPTTQIAIFRKCFQKMTQKRLFVLGDRKYIDSSVQFSGNSQFFLSAC